MPNDLATLNAKLTTQLRDTGATLVWASTEKDDLLDWAVAGLWPRFSRPLDPAAATVALVTDTFFYALPTGVRAVSRVDYVDTNAIEFGPLHGKSWEIAGDAFYGTGKLHVSPAIVSQGGSLRLNGYGVYDTATNLIPDILVPLVLAKARAEAYRRIGPDRVKFKEWLAKNQVQNVSVNELLQFINEADNEMQRIEHSLPRVWMRPVPGRQG